MGWFSTKRDQFKQDWAAAGEALDEADRRRARSQSKSKPGGECSQKGCTNPAWQAGVCKGCGSAIF